MFETVACLILATPVVEAAQYDATLSSITVYSNSGPITADLTSSTATWRYDSATQVLSQTGGNFGVRVPVGPAGTLFQHWTTGLSIGGGNAATALTFECIEGVFGVTVAINVCGNYSFGDNGEDESEPWWGPGTQFNRDIYGDDVVLGPQQSKALYDGFTTSSFGTNLVLSNAAIVGGGTTLNSGYQWTLTSLMLVTPPPQVITPPDVSPAFTPGVAVANRVTTTAGLAVPVAVLLNDLAFTAPATVTVSSGPAQGTAVISGSPGSAGSVIATYTPSPGFFGTDTFVYSVADGVSTGTAAVTVTVLADTDQDGLTDLQDNCTQVTNPTQLDSDADGYGNPCDADLNNSGTVTTADFGLLRSVLGQAASASALAAAADLNGSGTVTTADFGLLRARLGTAPGPSARRGASNTYTVTGTVSGLTGSGLVLRNNGSDNLGVSANGPFAFATGLANGAGYNVSVPTQPGTPSQSCAVSGGTGVVGPGAPPNVNITCTTNSYTVGGTISGRIASSGPLVLKKNVVDTATPPGNGAYFFGTPLLSGAKYEVKATTQPSTPNQTCNVQNGAGTVSGNTIANANVACGLNGTFYYSVNVGTNTLSIYRVTGGSFTLAGTVTTAAGPTSVATDPTNRVAYVTSSATNSILYYAINRSTGALTLIATYPTGNYPNSVNVAPNGASAWVINGGDNSISTFRINSDGTLTALASPNPTGSCAYGMEFFLGYPAPLRDFSGVLPPDDYAAVWTCTLDNYPQVPAAHSPQIWQYRINSNGTLNYLGWSWWAGPAEPTDPPNFLPITVDDGCLSPPIKTYVANPGANTISLYYGTDSCGEGRLSLTFQTTFSTGPTPRAITVNASRTYAYVPNAGNSTLSTFSVDFISGYLTLVSSAAATGPDPVAVTLDPDGVHLYVENAGDNTVSYYTINPGTGQPTLTNVQ